MGLCCGSRRADDVGGSLDGTPVSLPDTAVINNQYQSEALPERQVGIVSILIGEILCTEISGPGGWSAEHMERKLAFAEHFPRHPRTLANPQSLPYKPQLQKKRGRVHSRTWSILNLENRSLFVVGCICINTYICAHEEKSWVCSALGLKVKAGCRNASRDGDVRQNYSIDRDGSHSGMQQWHHKENGSSFQAQ